MPAHNTYGKAAFQMKITAILLTLLALSSPTTPAQDSTHLNLPEGAVARLGKGRLTEIQYSPDGTRLAVALFTGHTVQVVSVSFSPNGKTLASGSWDGTVQLWKVAD